MQIKARRATVHCDFRRDFSQERQSQASWCKQDCAVSALVEKLNWYRKQGFLLYITLAVAEKQISTDTLNLQINIQKVLVGKCLTKSTKKKKSLFFSFSDSSQISIHFFLPVRLSWSSQTKEMLLSPKIYICFS